MKNIKDWNSEETFTQMDNIMVDQFPSMRDLIWQVIRDGSQPTQDKVAKALVLDLFGFIPDGNKD